MTLQPDTVLNNRYRIVKQLGHGGFGAVYLALDLSLKRSCALKENKVISQAAQRQFEREAILLANLYHPNLPRVTDHFIIPDVGQYLVMDYIEGEDLQKKINKARGPLPEAEVIPWMLQILAALEYLHSQTPPIIHRDVKPANIRITPGGNASLVDFGIAKQYDPKLKTTQGARGYTPSYSPIEQYGQKPTDTRTDIYALGATFYAALTGRTPPESIGRVEGASLPSARSINPALSIQIDHAIRRSMEILPDRRFQTVAEFKSALSSALAPHSPTTEISPPPQPSPPTQGAITPLSQLETIPDNDYSRRTRLNAENSKTLDPQTSQSGTEFPHVNIGNIHPLDGLIAVAAIEGRLSTIALPHDWANYGEIIATFKKKYGLSINELNPDAGYSDELAAIEANKESKGLQAPDVIDISFGHTKTAMEKGLMAKYKVANWDTIPMKDPKGYWWAAYFGVLAFEITKPAIENSPQDWEDLLKPEYKGKVALAGDVLMSNEAVMTIFAAGLSRTGGDIGSAPEAGLQFWKEMNEAGNFIPDIADQANLTRGETPLTIRWDYLALTDRDKLAGNPEIEIIVPNTGVVAGLYTGAISAYAPHPSAARLWWEFVMSDEGQLLYLKGYVHPIRFNDMVNRGVVPQKLLATMPPPKAYQKAVFLSIDEYQTVTAHIRYNWRRVVFGE